MSKKTAKSVTSVAETVVPVEPHVEFTVLERLNPAGCVGDGSRFSMSHVLITKFSTEHPDGVFLTATDGQVLSVAQLPGETDAPHYIPPKIIKRGKTRKGTTIKLTAGRWEADGQFLPHDDSIGMFANIPPMLSSAVAEPKFVQIELDAALLIKLADAISGTDDDLPDRRYVTLLLPEPNKDGVIADTVTVLGGKGFGLIMPTNGQGESLAASVKKFGEHVEQYNRTFGQPTIPTK